MIRYNVPAAFGEAEYVEKRSRFIGRVWPVADEAEAVARIKEMREKHWDATHNVYAYIIREGGVIRYSDDGEPGGTSGMPTLNVFRSGEIYDVCCVVTRYFGGILLGSGGLVRAYSNTAKLALEAAGTAVMGLWKRQLLSCTYAQFERVRNGVNSFGGVIEDSDFGTDVLITALLPEDRDEAFAAWLTDQTQGAVKPEYVDEEFRAVKL